MDSAFSNSSEILDPVHKKIFTYFVLLLDFFRMSQRGEFRKNLPKKKSLIWKRTK